MEKNLLKKTLFILLKSIAILLISFVILLIVVSFPILVYFCVWLFSQMVNSLPLQFEMQVDDSFSLTVDSYGALILSALSFIATTVLAWFTFRLSIKINDRTIKLENNSFRILLNNMITEINDNIALIEKIANKAENDFSCIRLQYKESFSNSQITFTNEEIIKINKIYTLFSVCKEKRKLSDSNKDEWFSCSENNIYTFDDKRIISILEEKLKEMNK